MNAPLWSSCAFWAPIRSPSGAAATAAASETKGTNRATSTPEWELAAAPIAVVSSAAAAGPWCIFQFPAIKGVRINIALLLGQADLVSRARNHFRRRRRRQRFPSVLSPQSIRIPSAPAPSSSRGRVILPSGNALSPPNTALVFQRQDFACCTGLIAGSSGGIACAARFLLFPKLPARSSCRAWRPYRRRRSGGKSSGSFEHFRHLPGALQFPWRNGPPWSCR